MHCVIAVNQLLVLSENEYSYMYNTVRLEKNFPFCYRCMFLKQCDRLRSVPFYYRSPFRFFCRLRLNGTVSPPFLGTCNTYVRTTSIDVTPTRLTLAVGSLVLQCLTAYSDYTNYYHRLTAYSDYTNYYHR